MDTKYIKTRVNSILDRKLTHNSARNKLIDEFNKHKNIHAQAIEHNYHPGVPDLNVCIRGVEWWIEVKINDDPLRPNQQIWMELRKQCGGNVCVVRFKNSKVMVQHWDRETNSLFTYDSIGKLIENFIQ